MRKYFPDYPEKLNPVANDLILIADSQDLTVDNLKKFKHVKLGNTGDVSVQSLTYAALSALVTASDLVVGARYLITDATTANIGLIVEAIAVNKIHTDAKSPLFPQDVIEYDYTNDVIKWRWDTITNILVAQDLRNLSGITIGTGCSNITLGPGVTGTIGNNCRDIRADRDCVLSIGNASLYISLGVETTFTCGTDAYDAQIGGDVTATFGNFCSKFVIGSGSAVTIGNGNNNFVVGSDTTFDCVAVANSNAINIGSNCDIYNIEHTISNKSFLSGVSQDFTGIAITAAIFDINYSATVQGSNDGETYITFLTGATATTQLATDPV